MSEQTSDIKKRRDSANRFKYSPKGVLCRIYSEQRHKSQEKERWSLSYSRQEFYDRYLADPHFLSLFDEWVKSGYQKSKVPSIDRIDPHKGYSMDNIQMITWAENYAKGLTEYARTPVIVSDLSGNLIGEFDSVSNASRATGVDISSICDNCVGRLKQTHGLIFSYRGDTFRTKKSQEKFKDRNAWRESRRQHKPTGEGHYKRKVIVFRWGQFFAEFESIKALFNQLHVKICSNSKSLMDTGRQTKAGYQFFSSIEKARIITGETVHDSPETLAAAAKEASK